jgi:hypothetical protein
MAERDSPAEDSPESILPSGARNARRSSAQRGWGYSRRRGWIRGSSGVSRWRGARVARGSARNVDRQRHGARCLDGHHAIGAQRVHLLGRGCQAGEHPRAPHPAHPGRVGGRPASTLLLARMQASRPHGVARDRRCGNVSAHPFEQRGAVGPGQTLIVTASPGTAAAKALRESESPVGYEPSDRRPPWSDDSQWSRPICCPLLAAASPL